MAFSQNTISLMAALSFFHCLDTKSPIKYDHRKILPAHDSCGCSDMHKLSKQKSNIKLLNGF